MHGLEQSVIAAVPHRKRGAWRSVPKVVRYADDLVILHPDLETLLACKQHIEQWLKPMGLQLKASKTHITHTLYEHEGRVGFDFLGFTIRQFPVGKHRKKAYQERAAFKTIIRPSREAQKRHLLQVKATIRKYRSAPQVAPIARLNPMIRGWRQYYCTSVASEVFNRQDHLMAYMLLQWGKYRHPKKGARWRYRRYWQRRNGKWEFGHPEGILVWHADIPIQRHIKVKGEKSPYDGDWVYWGQRLGRDPTRPKRVVMLLKQQGGKCAACGLYLTDRDRIEVHHRNQNKKDNRRDNLGLVHGHCHDRLHGSVSMTNDL
jgi:RNA-directed DNA polymerase